MRAWLKELRIKKGLTQCEVAKKCEISRSYYTHIERGKKTPKVAIAKKIAKELKFDWKIFFDDDCYFKEHNHKVG
ncbi:MAG TPA: helix-turn-helix domain-containing protein [Firmicutes bacterium]|nr:helix-turn-helix domain-containing protein [Bacillota bacterium]